VISRRLGRYEIDRLLGEGGVGRVYAAHDTLLARQVAIKVLRPEVSRNRDFVGRFVNEAKSFGDLRHPNIATLYDLDLASQHPHMVMELVEGRTLEELLEWGPMPASVCLAVIAQAAAGLAAAHRRGVIHRDIKPANLIVSESGLLKIMDFGIARIQGSQRLTRTNQVFATLLYASPEQLRGQEVDARSDVYSLGAVAYEMLVGSPPFAADSDAELRSAQLEMPPPPLRPRVPGLNPAVEAGVLRALAKRPRDRFATVEEFAASVGTGAVRRDATEILEGYLAPIEQRVAQSQATRLLGSVRRHPDPTAAPRRRLRGPGTSSPDISGASGALRGESAVALRRPIAVLCATVLAFVLGLGYITWPITTASPPAPPPPSSTPAPQPPQPDGPPAAPLPAPMIPREPPPNPSPLPDEPLPAPRAVVPNLPDIPDRPPERSAFLGAWIGTWNNSTSLRGNLIVKEVHANGGVEAEYYYGWGSALNHEKYLSGSQIGKDTIAFADDEGGNFRFTLAGGVLQARFSSRTSELNAQFVRVGGGPN
jgi:serine/threonine protein kinase